MQLISEEIKIPIKLQLNDMKIEGITQNQSFGLEEKDKPAIEILLKILKQANPDGKLIYVIKKVDGKEEIWLTTRVAAATRKDELTPDMVKQPPTRKRNNRSSPEARPRGTVLCYLYDLPGTAQGPRVSRPSARFWPARSARAWCKSLRRRAGCRPASQRRSRSRDHLRRPRRLVHARRQRPGGPIPTSTSRTWPTPPPDCANSTAGLAPAGAARSCGPNR